MSREYVESRIREALRQTGGNATKTRQLIVNWCQEDHRLLYGLAQPHLSGIVAHAVSRVVSNSEKEPEEVPENPEGIDLPPDQFGRDLLNALSGKSAMFGQESTGAPLKKKGASQRHIDAIRQMTAKKTGE